MGLRENRSHDLVAHEVTMSTKKQKGKYTILDLEKVNTLNAEGCPACGAKFNLGDPVVLACGPWPDSPKYVHVDEAVYDEKSDCYFEKRHYESLR